MDDRASVLVVGVGRLLGVMLYGELLPTFSPSALNAVCVSRRICGDVHNVDMLPHEEAQRAMDLH